ncbi:single-stranded-DNA-specific exonuclease RecJ [Hyphomicrobium sulfonivorans]|uniref:single-stranded-DNA-specific exonuclease RecJ n=1 Tax=Hyphomicrobium sulfonivorans TaxID=121290 RepID=UPI00157151F0|nr:single-stranded-DNA-specific exonuclease RecJ [Hyphomicrobium sulfonivorans]MBI1650106.1 single-stranded-DNA-specific exonuclease RecJ [Hyphomicrobium sulfonivorans]NSL73023.1 single-stranded-DNA-specific exonuclease RecJ [Hyphomicrobium sulfonivorans]
MATALKQRETDAEFAAPFLGIASSARGFTWRERLTPDAHLRATTISQRHGLPELLGRMLAARGVAVDDVPVVLNPTLKALMPDPSTVRDMDAAAARIADAVVKGQRVAIFGDYDVDGASSSALVARFLSHHGLQPRIYIPDRLFEGYGPNPAAIETLVKEGAQLIITVDCGTTSREPLARAAELGCDVVIIDHHQADEELPIACAVVNPNRQDDVSGLGHLCAAGVCFMVLVAATRELRQRGFYGEIAPPDLMGEIDLVALATIADVVPLVGLNRAYVTQGLQVMRWRKNIGLRALIDAAGLNEPPTPYHLGFILGPRINAGGRIGDAALGSRLLAGDDEADAARIAALLDRLNKERRDLEKQMLEEALGAAEAKLMQQPDAAVLLVGSHTWHKGVVGLVASRLTEKFRLPSCVIAWGDETGGEGTGSLRSLPGADIGGAVRAAVAAGHLIKGGGHSMAAGLTVARENIAVLEAFLQERLQGSVTEARARDALQIDGALTPGGVTDELIDLIGRVGPYGQGNPTPRFAFPAVNVKFAKIVGEAHVRCVLQSADGSKLEAIAFRAAGQPLGDMLLGSGGLPLHVAGSVKRSSFNGRDKLEVHIDDVADPRRQG